MLALRWLSVGLVLVLLAGPALAADGGAQYRTVSTTEFGRAVVGQRVDARTVKAAILLTLQDLQQVFGVAPTVGKAYEDSKDPHSGGASFQVAVNGIAVKGLVTCKVGPQSTTVGIVYVRADAPAAEWRKLTQGEAAEAPPSGGAKNVAAGKVPLRTYSFPDGTGSIGLPQGWRTPSQTVMQGVVADGPDDAQVMISSMMSVLTPKSPLARMGGSLVAPYAAPVEVVRILGPQLSRMSVRNGGPARSYDNLVSAQDRKPIPPAIADSLLTLGLTEQSRAGSAHFKVMASVSIVPIDQTSFMLTVTQAKAPDATYERDLPVMLEVIASLRTNDAAINQRSAQALEQKQQWFANQQAAHRQQIATYDAQNKQYWDRQRANDQQHRDWERRQNSNSRGNDNADEVIRGVRTVEDTRTGERRSVDLGNVDKVVDDLNERDPGRYRQIPLRDEADPVPQR